MRTIKGYGNDVGYGPYLLNGAWQCRPEDIAGLAECCNKTVTMRCPGCPHQEHPAEDAFQLPPIGGTKHDDGKPPLSLISRDALMAEGEVLAFGARKYAAHNWRKGFAWSRLLDATLRHVNAFADGEDNDPETGLSHIAHARATLGFLLEHVTRSLGTDDRFKRAALSRPGIWLHHSRSPVTQPLKLTYGSPSVHPRPEADLPPRRHLSR